MKRLLLGVSGLLVMAVISAFNGVAEEIRYIGKLNGQDAAVVTAGYEIQVSVGTSIPGCGTVTQITDTHLIVERRLSDSEKEALKRQGAAAYSVIETHIPREDLRLIIGP
ncbi:MAG TPA: hypothetical protein DCR97_06870 [Deltaproteobacteria bacterium]|nr:hypothetical protein [Deltaproteobacteria bacterium]